MTKLELVFSTRDDRTYLKKQFVSSPLKIIRPFELPDGQILLQLLNVGPGVMAGDNFNIDIKLEKKARVILISQAANKLHTMPEDQKALQHVHISLESEAELEYYPGLTIPFKHTTFEQTVCVELAHDASFAFLERWAMGRLAFDEKYVFERLKSQIKVYQNASLLFADALDLDAKSAGTGLTDGFSYLATGVWVWQQLPQTSCLNPIQKPQIKEDVLTSSQFKENAAYLRALANDGIALTRQLSNIVNDWRTEIGNEKLNFERFGIL